MKYTFNDFDKIITINIFKQIKQTIPPIIPLTTPSLGGFRYAPPPLTIISPNRPCVPLNKVFKKKPFKKFWHFSPKKVVPHVKQRPYFVAKGRQKRTTPIFIDMENKITTKG